jgi:hypothetical protein
MFIQYKLHALWTDMRRNRSLCIAMKKLHCAMGALQADYSVLQRACGMLCRATQCYTALGGGYRSYKLGECLPDYQTYINNRDLHQRSGFSWCPSSGVARLDQARPVHSKEAISSWKGSFKWHFFLIRSWCIFCAGWSKGMTFLQWWGATFKGLEWKENAAGSAGTYFIVEKWNTHNQAKWKDYNENLS